MPLELCQNLIPMRVLLALVLFSPLVVRAESLVWSEQGPEDHAASFLALDTAVKPTWRWTKNGGKRDLGPSRMTRRSIATLPVAAGFEPRAHVSRRGSYLAATTLTRSRNRERGGTLWRIGLPGGEPAIVDQDVHYLQRPLALDDGRIIYLKVSGEHPAPLERTRHGELDEATTAVRVALPGGETRTIATDRGYGLFLAGVGGEALVLYRVAADGAAFFTVPLAGGALERLSEAPAGPFARDFSIQGKELTFASRAKDATYAIFSLNFETGSIRARVRGTSDHATPLSTVGALLYTSAVSEGLEQLVVVDGTGTTALTRSEGVPLLEAASADGAQICFRKQLPTAQELWRIDRRTRDTSRVDTKGFFSVAGFGEVP